MTEAAEPSQLPPPAVGPEQAVASVRAVAFDCYGTLLQLEERDFANLIHGMLVEHGVSHTTGEEVWAAWIDASRGAGRIGRDRARRLASTIPSRSFGLLGNVAATLSARLHAPLG